MGQKTTLHLIARNTIMTVLFICSSLYSIRAEITATLIDVDDVKPAGALLGMAMGAIGKDPYGVIYFGFCDIYKGVDDVLMFTYDTKTGEKEFLGTLRETAAAQNNLGPCTGWNKTEAIMKGHSHIAYMDGKMYMGTQEFHDIQGSPQPDTYRGSHIFSIDCETHELYDESVNMPEGVFERGQGMIALTALPELGLIVGEGHPSADVVMYNPSTHDVKIVHPPADMNGQHTGRGIVATPQGKIYWSRGFETLPVYEYDITTEQTRQVATHNGGFWDAQAETWDRKHFYVSTFSTLYHLNAESGQWNQVGSFTGNCFVWGLAMSRDEKKVYWSPHNNCGGNNHKLFEMNLETGERTQLIDLQGTYGCSCGYTTGCMTADDDGRIYFLWNDGDGLGGSAGAYGTHKGRLLQIDVSERSGESPVAVKDRRPRTGRTFARANLDMTGAVPARVLDLKGRTVMKGASVNTAITPRFTGRPGVYIIEYRAADGSRKAARSAQVFF